MTAPKVGRLRCGLALLRLFMLYAILCAGILALIVALRARFETDPLAAPIPSEFEIPSLGVTVELEQYDADGRVIALDRLRAAGFGWVRQRVDWGKIEPSPGDFRWDEIDAILADVIAANLVPVVVLDGSPPWARERRDAENPLSPPANPSTFARFAARFADRYGEIVRFYQIWDEPNIAPHWGDRLVEPVGYARLLEEAATAIRAADENAVIVMAALAPTADRGHTAIDEVYFLQRLYAAGAAPFFDVVAVQPFGFATPPDDPRSRVDVLNFARLRLIRRALVAAGDGETPIWAVRFGWNRQTNAIWRTVTPDAQIRYTEDALTLARSEWPWIAALGWAIDRPAAPADDPRWGFALVTPDDEPTPLVSVFAEGEFQRKEAEEQSTQRGGERIQRRDAEAQRRIAEKEQTSSLRIGLIVVGMVVVLWRGMAAARQLPLSIWGIRYRSATFPLRLVLWTILIVIYYFATWPPLIGLCWLAAALLIVARPLDGLLLAVALLPFHFRHKEIDLVAFTLAVPPAQAAILCTVPAIAYTILFNAKWQSGKERKDSKTSLLTSSLLPFFPSSLPLCASASLRLYVKSLRLRVDFADVLALSFLGISLISALNVWHWPGYWAGMGSLVIIPLLLFVNVRIWMGDADARRAVVMALGIGGALAGGIGLIDWLGGGGEVDGVRRLMGLTFSPNQTALYLLRALFVLIGLALSGWRSLAWIGVGVVALAIFLTGSRGALFLGLPAGIATILWLRGVRPQRRVMLALIVIGGIAALVTAGLLGDRLLNSETVLRRFAVWQGAWALWLSYPLAGVGPGGFFWRYPAFIIPAAVDEPNLIHAHNLWLNFGTTWGILGLIWLVALVIWLGWQMGRIRHRAGDWIDIGLLAALVAALAHAQVDAFALLPELAACNWLILALIAQRIQNKNLTNCQYNSNEILVK
ncbi:MAG: O-antigen ligase family protein [Caldilineaceae bacterium]|nr:O-antigen ligase family protein [Caldilineaceae bacterium]